MITMPGPRMVTNSFGNKSFIQPMRRLSMHSSGVKFFSKFKSHVYKMKRWAVVEHVCFHFATGAPMRCFCWEVPEMSLSPFLAWANTLCKEHPTDLVWFNKLVETCFPNILKIGRLINQFPSSFSFEIFSLQLQSPVLVIQVDQTAARSR